MTEERLQSEGKGFRPENQGADRLMSYERWCVEEREQASLKYDGTRKGAFRNQNQCSSKRPHGAFLGHDYLTNDLAHWA